MIFGSKISLDEPDWSEVHKALDKFFAGENNREMILSTIKSNADFANYLKLVENEERPVKEAFYEATKDRNSRDTILLYLAISDAVRMSKYEKAKS